MAALDTVSLGILLGSAVVLAGILSSVLALRFGAPLLLVFLLIGVLAGESGPGKIKFDDVHSTYIVGSVALALILFDGGLHTRFATFKSVLAPAGVLATVGVLITAAVTAPVAKYALGLNWTEAMLLGSVIASTDAAAVFFLINAGGLRLRPRVGATLEVESGGNDPFAIFLTLALVETLLVGHNTWADMVMALLREAVLGAVVGLAGGQLITFALNRLGLAQGLHAAFVVVAVLVLFAFANLIHSSGFLAAYLAGLVLGNQKTRAHNSVIAFLDVTTWLAQIVMFVLLGLLAWPVRLLQSLAGALAVAAVLMFVARPVAVFASVWPFGFTWREKVFMSWVGLRGAVGIFLAAIPLLVGLPNAPIYFDVAFVVVVISLLVQGWTIAPAARKLGIALKRAAPTVRRVELDLPGQLEQELVGYAVTANSPYLRRGLIPSWAKPALMVRDKRIVMPQETQDIRVGDYVYLLAPPEKAQSLDRFFVNMPVARLDPKQLADFFVPGSATLGALAEIYDLTVSAEHTDFTLTQEFADQLQRPVKRNDIINVGPIALLAHEVVGGAVKTVGLQLAAPDEPEQQNWQYRLKAALGRLKSKVAG